MKRLMMFGVLICLCVSLSGCFFLFLPTGLIRQALQEKRYCVNTSQQVGNRVALADGRVGTITEIVGPYSGCKEVSRPIAVLLKLDEPAVAEK